MSFDLPRSYAADPNVGISTTAGYRDYLEGDECWIIVKGKRVQGKVVAVLDLEGFDSRNYVVQLAIKQEGDPILKVRDGWSMARTQDGPMGYMVIG